MELAVQPSADVCLPAQPVTSIYVLRDPDTDAVRYVGKTIMRPEIRLIEHRNNPVNEEMAKWFQSLGYRKPAMQIIEEVTPAYNWPSREKFWIDYFHSRGCNLLNVQAGGLSGPLLRSSTKWPAQGKSSKRLRPRPLPKPIETKPLYKAPQEATCLSCGNQFLAVNRNGNGLSNLSRKYCDNCPSPSRYQPKPKRFTFTCVGCGITQQTHCEVQRYCTQQCRNQFQNSKRGANRD